MPLSCISIHPFSIAYVVLCRCRLGFNAIVGAFQRQIGQIQFRVDGTFEMPDRSEELDYVGTVKIKIYIDGFFLAIISLACLYAFFRAHG